MSKDIRSFFAPVKGSSCLPVKAKQSSNGKAETKKRVYNISESDEEVDDAPKPQSKKARNEEVAKPTKKVSPSKKESKPVQKIDVKNFFGDSPVLHKSQTLIKAAAPKPPEDEPIQQKSGPRSKKRKKHDSNGLHLENHFDDDFDATLSMLDDDALGITPKKVAKLEVDDAPSSVEKTKRHDAVVEKKDSAKKAPKKAVLEVTTKNSPKITKEKEVPPSELDTKRKANAQAYQRFLTRGGPRNPGSKPIPVGAPNCLESKVFVISGVLESLDREEAAELIQKYGGRVTSSVSKKTSYIVIGDEPGESKVRKAEEYKIPQIYEDDLLKLIGDSMKGKEKKHEDDLEHSMKGKKEKREDEQKHSKYFSNEKVEKAPVASSSKKLNFPKEEKKKPSEASIYEKPPLSSSADSGISSLGSSEGSPPAPTHKVSIAEQISHSTIESTLWVDKYKPKNTKNIIGQTGDKSNVKKLTKWLTDWHKHHGGTIKKKPSGNPRFGGDDGVIYKAALLSGPPGVGKTTSVHLVCQELGLDMVEFNASDTRSKRLLGEQVAELLGSKSIRGFCKGSGVVDAGKHVLVMDEVDGMAGNEDRGGVQELIQLIKKTRTPIICMCNDRSHPKMRSLVNYCFDLRFSRPRVEQIKAAMMSICFKEGLKVPPEALSEMITSANQDVRQVIHNLSMWCVKDKNLTAGQAHIDASKAKKSLKLGPWDVVRQVFSKSDQEKSNLRQKEDLFFQDYNLGPLFVQDTYIHVKPFKASGNRVKTLGCLSRAADSLAWGDVIERKIRSQNAWGLLPAQAYFSSVIPGHEMAGHVMGQIQFPAWLGKNSKRSRIDRITQELHIHTRLRTSGSKQAMTQDYAQSLRDAILRPLIKDGADGVQDALHVMKYYQLLREDLDSLVEISHWPGKHDPFTTIDSKIKAAFTRAYNKDTPATPYAVIGFKKTKQSEGDLMELETEEGEADEEGDEEPDDISSDAMIKKGKSKKEAPKKQKEAAGPSKEKKSKGKGKNKK